MRNLLLCLTLSCAVSSFAQQKIKSVEVSDTIIYATIDRPGDLYLVTKEGQIQKFDKDGKLLIVYKHQGAPTLFDPRDGSRIFCYYREQQQYDYYNPSFEVTASYRIDPAFAIQPWLMCPSGDHKLWILDNADNSLKKINAQHTEVELEVLIDSTLIKDASSFVSMREYQGFVFILNPKKGIYIFNSLGIHIRTIEEKGLNTINFLGEELYFLKGNEIKFFNLFSAENRSIAVPKPAGMVLLTDERQFLILKKSVEILTFKP
jgi:hypothetical protein